MKGSMHHVRERRQRGTTNSSVAVRWMDKVIYLVAIVGPFFTLDQLSQIWIDHNARGVSLFTWGSFATMSFIWMVYGILHKEKPIIISNALWVVLETLVAIGVFIYR